MKPRTRAAFLSNFSIAVATTVLLMATSLLAQPNPPHSSQTDAEALNINFALDLNLRRHGIRREEGSADSIAHPNKSYSLTVRPIQCNTHCVLTSLFLPGLTAC